MAFFIGKEIFLLNPNIFKRKDQVEIVFFNSRYDKLSLKMPKNYFNDTSDSHNSFFLELSPLSNYKRSMTCPVVFTRKYSLKQHFLYMFFATTNCIAYIPESVKENVEVIRKISIKNDIVYLLKIKLKGGEGFPMYFVTDTIHYKDRHIFISRDASDYYIKKHSSFEEYDQYKTEHFINL